MRHNTPSTGKRRDSKRSPSRKAETMRRKAMRAAKYGQLSTGSAA